MVSACRFPDYKVKNMCIHTMEFQEKYVEEGHNILALFDNEPK